MVWIKKSKSADTGTTCLNRSRTDLLWVKLTPNLPVCLVTLRRSRFFYDVLLLNVETEYKKHLHTMLSHSPVTVACSLPQNIKTKFAWSMTRRQKMIRKIHDILNLCIPTPDLHVQFGPPSKKNKKKTCSKQVKHNIPHLHHPHANLKIQQCQ